jgi:hypothetical protein
MAFSRARAHFTRPAKARLIDHPQDWADFPAELARGRQLLARGQKTVTFPDRPAAAAAADDEGTYLVVRHNLPTSFHGFRIDNQVICMGFHVWFPSFKDCVADQVDKVLLRMLKQYFAIAMDGIEGERLVLNGHRMPRLVAFRSEQEPQDPAWEMLSRVWDYYVQSVCHYFDLHCEPAPLAPAIKHPDLMDSRSEIPELNERRLDARAEEFWPDRPGKGARTARPGLSEKAAARQFFGGAAFEHGTLLVPIHRVPDTHRQRNESLPRWSKFPTDVPYPPGDPEATLAVEDLHGAIYLMKELGRLGANWDVVSDSDIHFEKCINSVVGYGLTQDYVTGLESHARGLFRIGSHDLPPDQEGRIVTLGFLQVRGLAPEPPEPGEAYCWMVRLVLPFAPPGSPGRVFLSCAGTNADGTAAAGWFLANRWKNVLELYETHKQKLETDSLALVLRYRERTKSGRQDATVEIARSKDAWLAAWATL